MITYELFENEERLLVNRMTANVDIEKIGKKNFEKSLNMAMLVNDDAEVKGLVKSVYNKVAGLTDEEWEVLKKQLPWECVDGTQEEELHLLEEE